MGANVAKHHVLIMHAGKIGFTDQKWGLHKQSLLRSIPKKPNSCYSWTGNLKSQHFVFSLLPAIVQHIFRHIICKHTLMNIPFLNKKNVTEPPGKPSSVPVTLYFYVLKYTISKGQFKTPFCNHTNIWTLFQKNWFNTVLVSTEMATFNR